MRLWPGTQAVLKLVIASATWGCSSTSYSAAPPAPTPHAKTIEALPSLAFSPSTITIGVGDTVTFAFEGVPHNVFFDAVAGAPADVPGSNTNTNVARVFAAPGQYVYNCHIHPGMRGTVVVAASS